MGTAMNRNPRMNRSPRKSVPKRTKRDSFRADVRRLVRHAQCLRRLAHAEFLAEERGRVVHAHRRPGRVGPEQVDEQTDDHAGRKPDQDLPVQRPFLSALIRSWLRVGSRGWCCVGRVLWGGIGHGSSLPGDRAACSEVCSHAVREDTWCERCLHVSPACHGYNTVTNFFAGVWYLSMDAMYAKAIGDSRRWHEPNRVRLHEREDAWHAPLQQPTGSSTPRVAEADRDIARPGSCADSG